MTDTDTDTDTQAAADVEPAPGRGRPSKAERLEAKAARLREAAARKQEASAAGPARPRGLVAAVAGLAVLAAGLATVLGIGYRSWQHQRDLVAARASAVHAARAFAVQFGSYDYRQLDREFAAVATHLTAGFKKEYLATSRGLKATLVQYKGRSSASVAGIGYTSGGESSATVVVFLDQTVTNTQSTVPRIDRNRLEIRLVRQHGTWLVGRLTAK